MNAFLTRASLQHKYLCTNCLDSDVHSPLREGGMLWKARCLRTFCSLLRIHLGATTQKNYLDVFTSAPQGGSTRLCANVRTLKSYGEPHSTALVPHLVCLRK